MQAIIPQVQWTLLYSGQRNEDMQTLDRCALMGQDRKQGIMGDHVRDMPD